MGEKTPRVDLPKQTLMTVHHPPHPVLVQLYRNRLRRIRGRSIRYPPRRQEEQRDDRPAARLRVVMGARAGRRPAGSLPAAHAAELRAIGNRDDAIDLAVRMQVVLAAQDTVSVAARVHVDGGDAAEARRRRRRADARAAVVRPLHLVGGDPALVVGEAGADQPGKVVVKRAAGAVLVVEARLEIAARGAVCADDGSARMTTGRAGVCGAAYRFSTSDRNSATRWMSFWQLGCVLVDILME